MPPIVILAAVRPEALAIARELGNAAELYTIGTGARHLPWDISPQRAAMIIVAGVAGALDPRLRRGDVIVYGWPDGLPLPDGMRAGAIHTVEAICGTPQDKARLFRGTGAAVVDMEHGIVARACQTAGVPCIGVRAVLDTASECLDPALLGLVDEAGRPRVGRAMGFALKNPARVGKLIRLGRASRAATQRLGTAVRQVVESIGIKR